MAKVRDEKLSIKAPSTAKQLHEVAWFGKHKALEDTLMADCSVWQIVARLDESIYHWVK